MRDARAALLEAAAGEFARYGFKGTRVQDIVKAAGVNERMIYHYFGSKDGLYRAVSQDQRAWVASSWAPALSRAVSQEPLAGMRTALRGFFSVLQSRPQVAALLIHEGLGDASAATPEDPARLADPVLPIYARGQADGVFPAQVPPGIACSVAVTSLVALAALDNRLVGLAPGPPADLEQRGDQLVSQVLLGMTG